MFNDNYRNIQLMTKLLLALAAIDLSACNSGGHETTNGSNNTQGVAKSNSSNSIKSSFQLKDNSNGWDAWNAIIGQTSVQQVGVICNVAPSNQQPTNKFKMLTLKSGNNPAKDNGLSCNGSLIFSFIAQDGFAIKAADISGIPCAVNSYYIGCPVNMAVGQSAVISATLQLSPFARGGNTADVTATGNFGFAPTKIPISETLQGEVTATQAPLLIPSGAKAIETIMSVTNSGPSGAENVVIKEQFPAKMGVSVPTTVPNCSFDGDSSTLTCNINQMEPGQKIDIPIGVKVDGRWPFSQYQNPITVNSDLGTSNATGEITVAGGWIYGKRQIESQVSLNQQFSDVVELTNLNPTAGGVPAKWHTEYSDGIQVTNVTKSDDSPLLICSHDDHSVDCTTVQFGGGIATSAKATIALTATGLGNQSAKLSWISPTAGGGEYITNVQVNQTTNKK